MELEERVRLLEERVSALENKKRKVKYEKPKGAIAQFERDHRVNQMLAQVSQPLQRKWIKLYGDTEWIAKELLKADAWVEANPQRAPRSAFGRFYNAWLARAWERHRKTNTVIQQRDLDF